MKKTKATQLLAIGLTGILLGSTFMGCGGNTAEEDSPAATSADSVSESSNSADSTSSSSSGESADTSSASADGDVSGKKIAFISASNQFDFFVYMGAKVKQICEERGIEVDMLDANTNVTTESDLMAQAVITGYDAIIMGPVDSQALVPAVEEAIEAGIPVINYDSFMEGVDVHARVGSDNQNLGRIAGDYAVEFLEEKYGEVKGNIIVLTYPALETMNSRTAGFLSAFEEYPDVTIQEEELRQCDAETGQTMTDNLLIANPSGSVDIIFGANAGVIIGANAAVEAAGRDDVALIGIDSEQGELEAIASGGVFKATVAQDNIAIGEASIEAAISALQGEKTGDVVIPGILITADNVEEYMENDAAVKEELAPYL